MFESPGLCYKPGERVQGGQTARRIPQEEHKDGGSFGGGRRGRMQQTLAASSPLSVAVLLGGDSSRNSPFLPMPPCLQACVTLPDDPTF